MSTALTRDFETLSLEQKEDFYEAFATKIGVDPCTRPKQGWKTISISQIRDRVSSESIGHHSATAEFAESLLVQQ